MSKIKDQWIKSIKTELESIDFELMYQSISTDMAYDQSKMRRLAILGIFMADDKKLGQYIPVLSSYIERFKDSDHVMILEEILRLVIILEAVVKPDTQTNRLYI